ncbi:hypothetical protein MIND_01125300 [Mycena indigotica]|uniref:Uncharacterized protein n=1 Tax=Mycena indigotica TaxID=2126181 RepID=A0A8H6VVJ1_9AGAR|nr:uncharacterized protein MIND_01125300 [Mycena indigotica]KAF7293476.1 hypothetical protein MIND_01125300 [Mycena indigotica]
MPCPLQAIGGTINENFRGSCCVSFARSLLFHPPDDWDNTPFTTNTGELQHHWTKEHTGKKLAFVVGTESARTLDHNVLRDVTGSKASSVLSNPLNESSNRRGRALSRNFSKMQKSGLATRRLQLLRSVGLADELLRPKAAQVGGSSRLHTLLDQ